MGTRRRHLIVTVLGAAVVLSGCSAIAAPPEPTVRTAEPSPPAPTLTTEEPSATPSASPPSATPAEPDEDAFVTAVGKIDRPSKIVTRQALIDLGYNVCTILRNNPSDLPVVFPNPTRRTIYVDAAQRYLCR